MRDGKCAAGGGDGGFVQTEAAAQLHQVRGTPRFDDRRVDRVADVIEHVHQPVVLS
jgi:hypothetical protein